jgi:hypothetical protein
VYKVKLPEKSTAGVAGNPAIMDACFGCGQLAHIASGAVVPCSAARGTVVPLFIWPLLLFFPIYVLLVMYSIITFSSITSSGDRRKQLSKYIGNICKISKYTGQSTKIEQQVFQVK